MLERTIVHTITTRTVDINGDVVEPRGGRLDRLRRDGSVYYRHEPAIKIGRCLALDVSDEAILALTQFDTTGHPDVERTYRLYRDGFLTKWSMSLVPLRVEKTRVLPGQAGAWCAEWELEDYAAVVRPANLAARTRSAADYHLPPGATEQDLVDALRRDRQLFWDVAASLSARAATKERQHER